MDSLLRLLSLGTLCFILTTITPYAAGATYNIGIGRADSTGPIAEVVFMGYAKPDQKGSGLHLRSFSRCFIIDDGVTRFAFVTVDSAMIGHGVRSAVLKRLRQRFNDTYNEKNLMISGTHTHSAPGGFMMDVLFDITTFGFVPESFNALVNGITKSIERAHAAVVPGRIYFTKGELFGANINRSPSAYLNNPASERAKYEYDVDKTMLQLKFVKIKNNEPMGVINWFAVHPTSMNNTNKLVSSDNVGYASILFEKMINKNSMIGKGSFVAAFASTNLGDVSPNTRGPRCEFSGNHCSQSDKCPGRNEMCFASGPGKNMYESTSIIANKMYTRALDLWQSNDAIEVTGPVRMVHQYVDMPKEKAQFFNHTTGILESVTGCVSAMGYSFAAGTTDGPGSFAFEQGTTTSNPFWNLVRDFLAKPTREDVRCHGAKPILLPTGRITIPHEWQPQIVSTHVAFIGNIIIAGVPGEFTTMSGRRLRENINNTLQDAASDYQIVIAGLCNTYSDYITTPEEYEIQRYEGASTIYGPHTLTIYLQRYQNLISAVLNNETLDSGPQPPDLSQHYLISLVPPVFYDTPKWGYSFGDCIQQPTKVAAAGDTVSATFISGHPRNNPVVGGSFLIVERLEDDESWTTVATDADWETKFDWKRTLVVLGWSEAKVTWTIPDDVEPGQYRLRHDGNSKNLAGVITDYHGVSNQFEVVAFGSRRRKRYYFA